MKKLVFGVIRLLKYNNWWIVGYIVGLLEFIVCVLFVIKIVLSVWMNMEFYSSNGFLNK